MMDNDSFHDDIYHATSKRVNHSLAIGKRVIFARVKLADKRSVIELFGASYGLSKHT